MAPPIALRGSAGVWMVNGPPNLGSRPDFPEDKSKGCKVITFSSDGSLVSWCNGDKTFILRTSDYRQLAEIDKAKANCLKFSPRGTILALWENYTVNRETNQGNPNLHLYNAQTGELLKSLIQKKQLNWDPKWTNDEAICCRNVNNELHFFEANAFDTIKTKLHIQKVSTFALAESGPPYHVAGYVPGSKGQPSFVRIYRYPNFGGPQAALANKSFFKADDVQLKWNNAGTALLVLTSTESSDKSYYGDQGLHFMGTNGECCIVNLSKNGPIYHIEWSPRSTEFVVVYGFMPAKASIFNMKAEPVFDFGTGPRNLAYFNPHGNILCLAGFGNLHGNLEFWDMRSRKLMVQTQSQDTTSFEWCPDGEHVLTATTSPRLRVANGYRVWHCSGKMLLQVNADKETELWEALWQPAAEGEYPVPAITANSVTIKAAQSEPEPKVQAYRPPQARGTAASIKLHEYEAPSDPNKKVSQDPNKPMTKNQKKREAKKAKAQQDGQNVKAEPLPPAASNMSQAAAFTSSGDPDKDKKVRNLKKKIQQIEKLKEQQQSGKQLELNQIEKIKSEESLLQELAALEVS
ncbi:eukaryotic translation initiation factor 2A-like isoform X2 [Ostrea edulis]|uniref:eukaryotic translation initiation factor 2A-like isoform X2 n=1 Tax=Ostrea edulis TaxID=37623 RepID=UPI0024AF0899|nr:eukaryotic translation initiation factor 2A-like isoform X2 [Ostrea edulis]